MEQSPGEQTLGARFNRRRSTKYTYKTSSDRGVDGAKQHKKKKVPAGENIQMVRSVPPLTCRAFLARRQ